MLRLNRAGSQLLLLSMLLIASPAVAQDGLDKGPTIKPTHHTAVNAPFIIGGTPAGPNDNPFQVALLLKSDPLKSDPPAFFCGGYLIAPDLIVTAAHCGYYPKKDGEGWIPRPASELQVLAGTRSLSSGGERVDVISVTRNPNYERESNQDYDVAVWKLSRRVEHIPFARLAVSDGVPGSALLVTGWGRMSKDGETPARLRKVSLPVGSREDCAKNKTSGEFTPRMLCASTATNRGTCNGDSGGPATRGADNMTLTGITSTAFCGGYSFFTRVSDPSIRDFIRNFLN
jgi:secreted trypsin-like serine protease